MGIERRPIMEIDKVAWQRMAKLVVTGTANPTANDSQTILRLLAGVERLERENLDLQVQIMSALDQFVREQP